MVRLKFEDEDPRVLRRRSWFGVVTAGSSEEVRDAVSGERVSAEAVLVEEGAGFSVCWSCCCCCGCAAAASGEKVKLLTKGLCRSSRLVLEFSEGNEGNCTSVLS